MRSYTALLAIVAILFPWGFLSAREVGRKPNILWIITDDQRPDSIAAFNRIRRGEAASPLGQVLSPNVDRLAALGTTFINTFNHNPSCAPSRTIMHTGRYSHHTGVYGFEYYNPTGMTHWKPMVPEILRDRAGYQTISVGKRGIRDQHFAKKQNPDGPLLYETDLGYRNEFAAQGLVEWHSETKWSGGQKGPRTETFFFPDGTTLAWPEDNEASPNDAGAIRKRLDIFRAYRPGSNDADDGLGEILGGVNPRPGNRTRDANFAAALLDHLAHADQAYTDILGRKQQGPDSQRPVFAYCGFEFPHTPVLPPAEFRERFAELRFEVPQFTPGELAGFPPQILRFFQNWGSDHFTDAEKQQMISDYYAYCAYGDSLVGRLVDGFVADSEENARPWLILYVCGDNGWKLNEHGMLSKFVHYDHDLNNPIIVMSSDRRRFPPGKVVTDFTGFVDMAPTFLAVAGIDISTPEYEYLDGRDLAATAAGTVPARDYIIAEPTWVIGPRAVIRTKDYKFAMRVRPQPGNAVTPATAGKEVDWAVKADLKDIEPTLFDLRADPGEIHNVAFDPHYGPVVDALRKKLQDIVLGDGRVEVVWTKNGGDTVHTSNFAAGADNGCLEIPAKVPKADGADPVNGRTGESIQSPPSKPGERWVIRWNRSDDFSGATVDWRKWQKTPANFPAWQWDNDNNVSVSNGLLTITLRKRGDGIENSAVYTSGMLKSYATGGYGYFEARIKAAPLFPGVSPAFWLYSGIDDSQVQPGAVRYCEVDIVELTQRNGHTPSSVKISDHNLHAILSSGKKGLVGRHWRRPQDPRYRQAQALDYRAPFDPREDFHTYGCRVDKEWIIWFVDRTEVGRKPNELWHKPMNVALSLGLRAPYATWEDNRLKADPNAGAKEFATSMIVDYVRVWELAGDVP